MIEPFNNYAWRSADELLADLQLSRQLRHLSDDELRAVTDDAQSVDGERINLTYAFECALDRHGYCCDACQEVTPVRNNWLRRAADRILDNLDGRLKLILCENCSWRFQKFCRRQFAIEARSPYTAELEKAMLAWIAFEVRQIARKAANGK